MLFSLLMTACASSGVKAPMSDSTNTVLAGEAKVSGDSSQLKTYSVDPSAEISGEVLSQKRSVPPVVSNLVRESAIARDNEDWVKSEVLLQRALRISPKNAQLWSEMADVKLQQGKFSQAEQFARKSNSVSSDSLLQLRNQEIIEQARQR